MTLVIRTREQLRDELRRIVWATAEKWPIYDREGVIEALVAADYTGLDACESCQQLRDQLNAALKKLEAWCAISGARDLAAAEPTADSDGNTGAQP